MTTPAPTPEPVDFRTVPPKITTVATGWQAWWEDRDFWDGYLLYADIDTAKQHAAVDYVGEEYGWQSGDDPDDEAPEVTLTWAPVRERWHLLADGAYTGVQLYETHTYAAQPGQATAAVLRIVSDTVIEANDSGGIDLNDLVTRLEQAGYPLPDDDADTTAAGPMSGQANETRNP
ncbi:MAG: hypothetical protein JWO98_98 [Frankiales bacterium]|nr:hypothetical protein [Frankiales bacterium]